jgi:hypothetical protein
MAEAGIQLAPLFPGSVVQCWSSTTSCVRQAPEFCWCRKIIFSDIFARLLGVRHVTGTGSGLLGEIPRVVVQKSALL